MNLLNIISEIEKEDPEIYGRIDDRRQALKSLGGFASKVALLAVPLGFGTMFKKAYGQTTTNALDVLNFALKLEYLESEFYKAGVGTANLIPAAALPGFTTIKNHEVAHVQFLQAAITAAGGTPVAKPNFDFTAKGTFPDVFTNYATFLAVSQAFEDTGVRAYKGQAGNLKVSADALTAALRIHSVEARHASHVRKVRMAMGVDVKPWITGNKSGIGTAVAASYAGEENTTQANVPITNINGKSVSADAASEAFDEPLTMDQVVQIVTPFFA